MFAFVVFLAAIASLHAAPKHKGETDLTTKPLSNNITAYDKHDEGSYQSAMENASEKKASIHAKFKHTIALFNLIVKQFPVEKRENITNNLLYIFLKLKKFENFSSAGDDGDLEKSFEGKKLKKLNINKSKSIGNSTYLESRHHVDHSTLNNDILSSKHLDTKEKQFLKDLLSANKTYTHSLISLPSIHPLLFEFDNEGVKREKIKKDVDESEEENDDDNDKHQEVKTDSADRTDLNEDPISNFAQVPAEILFDDENEIPLQNNQNNLPVSQVAQANTWNQFQPENIMHRNINPKIAFNDLLASSTQMDENTNHLLSELTDIFGISDEENEAFEEKQGGIGDLTKNTFLNQVMLLNAAEHLSDKSKNKDDSKELHEKSVPEQFLHSNSIQKAIQNAMQFEDDDHSSNLKRSRNVHPSSDMESNRNLVHNLPKSKIPDTFLASSLQRIHTLDADSHFKEIPDPEKEIKALENLLKLAEGFSGPQNQHAQSFQDQNNFFIPLSEDKMFLQYLQSDGGDAIIEDGQESESEEENALQTNVKNRNGNVVLKGNSANGGDEEISPQSSSVNLIAALFPMEKQSEVSVIKFSDNQKEQKKESSEENLNEKQSIFRHNDLAQSRTFETKGNEVQLKTENSKESEEAGTSVVFSGRQQGHHKVNSDVKNIQSVDAIQNLVHIPEHSRDEDSNSKTRESSESKESSGSANQRKSESNEQKSSRGQDSVIALKSSSKSESNERDLSNTEGNIQSSSKSESNEQDSRIVGSNGIGSVNSRSMEQGSSNSGSDEIGSGNSESNEQDSSISRSNEQEPNISGISNQDSHNSMSNEQGSSNLKSNEQDSTTSESNKQDSSNSESNKQDSSKSESNEQDSSNSGSIEQALSDDGNQESKDSESQETRPVVFPPINHLDYIGDQLTRIDESKSESKIRKDVKPTTVIVKDYKPDVLPRKFYPQNDIPKDDLVFPRVQPKDDKSYVPHLPEDKRILLDIPVDNPVREINSNFNFDEFNDDLNLVPPIKNDDDLFIAIQNIERHLLKDKERNRQNHYKKKTNYDYNGIKESKYSNSKEIIHTGYSTKYNDPDFYNTKRTYGGIDNIKLTKYKKILPYTKNLYRNDVGYIEPEIYNRFLPYSDDTDGYSEGQIYRGSFGYQGPNSMYKKSTYSGHGLLKRTSKELYELNKIYMDSLGYQSLDSLYKKSTHSGHRLVKLTSKELHELNQIYRATRQYRLVPFAKSRNYHYPVLRSPHRTLNEHMRSNGDRSTGRILYGGRRLFGRRLFGGRIFNKEMTRPRHRAFVRQRFHGQSRTEHLSENRAYSYPDIYTRRQR